jgi:hypothetical protein
VPTGLHLWSRTAASNATADSSVNWAEGQSPSSVNDSARAMMARIAEWRDDLGGLTTGGSATAYSVSTNRGFASAAAMDKAIVTIIPHVTSGAAATLAVDGLAARQLRTATGVNVPAGALVAGTPYAVIYLNATTEFILLGGSSLELYGLAALAANGLIGRTAAGVYAARTLTGPAAGISISNGDGVSGNPTLALANDLAALEALSGTNTIPYRSGTDTWASVTIGAALSFASGSLTSAFGAALVHVRDERSSGTGGSSLTSGVWNTRTLQTKKIDDIGVTLSANQVSLPAGTYWCEGEAGTYGQYWSGTGIEAAFLSKFRLRNVTDSTTLLFGLGTVAKQNVGGSGGPQDNLRLTSISSLNGRFTLAGMKTIELQNYLSMSANFGSTVTEGDPVTSGENEVYADLKIWKIG